MSEYPSIPDRFEMGDKRRFHIRELNGKYQVYSIGLEHWAECNTQKHAQAIADALEVFFEEDEYTEIKEGARHERRAVQLI